MDGATAGALSGATATLIPSIDGANRDVASFPLTLKLDTARARSWVGRYTADNFDIALEGRMDLTTLLVETTKHGSR